jgi:transcriptional regulator with XRE-family HTH domain
LAAANEQLQAARERTASLTYPDECLSRQELAELVNAWIYEHHHEVMEASANYIGQLERGKIRWPGKLYREAFRAIFNVSTDSALGFVNTRRAVVKLDDVNRKQFFHTANAQEDARRVYRFALACAEQAKNWDLAPLPGVQQGGPVPGAN